MIVYPDITVLVQFDFDEVQWVYPAALLNRFFLEKLSVNISFLPKVRCKTEVYTFYLRPSILTPRRLSDNSLDGCLFLAFL